MLIKVCGMRDSENMKAVAGLDVDFMGMIFYPRSKRYVSEVPSFRPLRQKLIAVFVNADIDEIAKTVETFHCDGVQLHGDETPEFVRSLKTVCNRLIIKAFQIATADDLHKTEQYETLCDYFLFDTATPSYGGSGESFDWSVLEAYHGKTPFLLSGGIGAESVERIKQFSHPQCVGIDINSKFEVRPAMKDVEKIQRFVKELK
ncbi:MAG: phosphoribosylanthranilate isomerase [Bacteroidales bacterium]|nr:phosphoribosylanthranilate isomerase [Bacteroidales bacterium]